MSQTSNKFGQVPNKIQVIPNKYFLLIESIVTENTVYKMSYWSFVYLDVFDRVSGGTFRRFINTRGRERNTAFQIVYRSYHIA